MFAFNGFQATFPLIRIKKRKKTRGTLQTLCRATTKLPLHALGFGKELPKV
jgi:hypothetical protein